MENDPKTADSTYFLTVYELLTFVSYLRSKLVLVVVHETSVERIKIPFFNLLPLVESSQNVFFFKFCTKCVIKSEKYMK